MSPPVDSMEASLRSIAAWGLPGAEQIELPPDPEELGFASRLQQTRLIGPLLAASASGEVELPADLEADLVERQHGALLWCIQLESRLMEVREAFDSAGGIEHLVIKGPAIAHLDALDPSVRTFADIDLLVAGRDIDRAVEIIRAGGAGAPWAERRKGFDRRFAKSVTGTLPDGVEFDLHRTLADGVFGHRIPLDRLFAQPDHLDIGGVRFGALSPTHRLLHSAYHLLLGSPEPALMNLRDLGGYLADPTLDPDMVVPEAERWRGGAVLAMAIDLVRERLGIDVPAWAEWRTSYRFDHDEFEMIARHRREGSSLGRAKLDVARELPLRDKVAYLTALAWPQKAHLADRSLTRRDSLESLVDVLRRGESG
ncbi:MAG: nucleotidyltransferase family protein [Propionibacteriaceae bacterium]|nr:nucleotidyltransferase family protein [Propionibacteriaceae bacterium]MCB1029186.1 nucleotidyltransferase family protein [Microthrixaceae bacterium]